MKAVAISCVREIEFECSGLFSIRGVMVRLCDLWQFAAVADVEAVMFVVVSEFDSGIVQVELS